MDATGLEGVTPALRLTVANACKSAAEARRLLEHLEMHHTPKHGSWLNMAETALSVLATPCLDRRIPGKEPLTREVAAWGRQCRDPRCLCKQTLPRFSAELLHSSATTFFVFFPTAAGAGGVASHFLLTCVSRECVDMLCFR